VPRYSKQQRHAARAKATCRKYRHVSIAQTLCETKSKGEKVEKFRVRFVFTTRAYFQPGIIVRAETCLDAVRVALINACRFEHLAVESCPAIDAVDYWNENVEDWQQEVIG
jgi:hypothetical protein